MWKTCLFSHNWNSAMRGAQLLIGQYYQYPRGGILNYKGSYSSKPWRDREKLRILHPKISFKQMSGLTQQNFVPHFNHHHRSVSRTLWTQFNASPVGILNVFNTERWKGQRSESCHRLCRLLRDHFSPQNTNEGCRTVLPDRSLF